MKNILILIAFLLSSQILIGQVIQPIVDLRDRVSELPNTYPVKYITDPIRTPASVPESPAAFPPLGPVEFTHNHLRKVFFIPGLGGARDSWSQASVASQDPNANIPFFPARELDAVALSNEYISNSSLFAGARDMAQTTINPNADQQEEDLREFNFLIGHSQGGIVSKWLVYEDQCGTDLAKGNYGGLVTFGSPLNGAQIINSRVDGIINAAANDVCTVFQNSFLSTIFVGQILELFVTGADGSQGPGQDICDALDLNEDGEPGILAALLFSNVNTNMSEEYAVGHEQVDMMNACLAPDIAKIAFYGVEPYEPVEGAPFNNPIFYRVVQHFLKDVNDHEFFEANNDSKLAIEAGEKAAEAQKKAYRNFHLANTPLIFFNGPGLQALLMNRGFALQRVHNMYHDINDIWMGIIGALDKEYININPNPDAGYCRCDYNSHDDYLTEIVQNANTNGDCLGLVDGEYYQEFSNCIWISTPEIVVQMIEKPSDGVVLQESAQYMTGATHAPVELWPGLTELNTGSSHMQMRNDRNLKYVLNQLYEGNYDEWFKTAAK